MRRPAGATVFSVKKESFMDKIKVELCCGTACYVLGASRLLSLAEELPEDCRDGVEITPRPCLDLCDRENLGGAPYVRINGDEIIAQASPEKVAARIVELVRSAR